MRCLPLLPAILLLATPAGAGTVEADERAMAAEHQITACLNAFPADGPDIFAPAAACASAGETECRSETTGPEAALECLLAVNQGWFTLIDHWRGHLDASNRLPWELSEAMVSGALEALDMHCDVMLGGRDDDAALEMRLGCQNAETAKVGTWLRYLAATMP